MKKGIIILFIIVVIGVFINEKENILIPDNAIRFRIIANSNNKDDQDLKISIKKEVEKEIYKLIGNAKNTEEARTIIQDNLANVDEIVKKYGITYDISYGNNYFPDKYYKGIKYHAGDYESLVITLGKGEGHNWWCVLFPPLCLLDEKENIDDIDYEFYVKKIIDKFK